MVLGVTDQWLYSLVSTDIMNFDVAFRPNPVAVAFTAARWC
ncbi:hypothetical protein I552_8776 [Mycobacterium xenopi 3993]|nr:hypothetical protein I552_8776 [Mycobacterium xenopi 3993]